MNTHDPREHIRGIQQILISDKKRIGFLFGAGSSYATGVPSVSVPTIDSMTKTIVSEAEHHSIAFASAVLQIRSEIESDSNVFQAETLLSSIETKRAVIGSGMLNGLDLNGFTDLATLVKTTVVKLASIHESLKPSDHAALAHSRFANWIEKARRRFPVEIFTTNYDYLFEIALEDSSIPYFDGFSGSFEPFFCPEAVEDIDAYPHIVKLWKIHGSLGWIYRDRDKTVIRDRKAEAESILIYPSHLKYNSSKKQPYVGLIDRLCTFFQQDDAVLFTCGYSFSDNHINERIATSLRRGANSHVIALCFDERIDDDGTAFMLADNSNVVRLMATNETGGKMSAYGLRHAVIGGKLGEWKLKGEPDKDESIRVSQYFDEDAALLIDADGVHQGDENWLGKGRFKLPDFRVLADFLNDLSTADRPSAPLKWP